jgi:hypothetical protein
MSLNLDSLALLFLFQVQSPLSFYFFLLYNFNCCEDHCSLHKAFLSLVVIEDCFGFQDILYCIIYLKLIIFFSQLLLINFLVFLFLLFDCLILYYTYYFCFYDYHNYHHRNYLTIFIFLLHNHWFNLFDYIQLHQNSFEITFLIKII